MKTLGWILCGLLASWVFAGDVVVLTDDNFDQQLKSPVVMVKFYAPWCGHCKAFAPEYERAASMAKEQGKTWVLAELDGTVHRQVASRFGLSGYPTVKLFLDGMELTYEGERTADAVLQYLDKKTKPASEVLGGKEEIEEILEERGRKVILVSDDPKVKANYGTIARSMDEFEFFETSPAIGKEAFPKVTKVPAVVLLRDFDEPQLIYTGSITNPQFTQYLKDHMLPLVSPLNDEAVKYVFGKSEREGIVLFRTPEKTEHDAEFRKFAEAHKSPQYLFIVTGLRGTTEERITSHFGLHDEDLPVVEVITNKGQLTRYRHTGKIVLAELEAFLTAYKAGKIPRYIKSEPAPTSDTGPVLKLVATTFKAEVLGKDRDVLVKFYAEWCGHCKKLAPVYEHIAEMLKGNKKLVLAEVDATKNDIEGHSVNSFPTLKLFPGRNKGSPITFDGNKSEEDIIKFLQQHCSYPVNLPSSQKVKEGL